MNLLGRCDGAHCSWRTMMGGLGTACERRARLSLAAVHAHALASFLLLFTSPRSPPAFSNLSVVPLFSFYPSSLPHSYQLVLPALFGSHSRLPFCVVSSRHLNCLVSPWESGEGRVWRTNQTRPCIYRRRALHMCSSTHARLRLKPSMSLPPSPLSLYISLSLS